MISDPPLAASQAPNDSVAEQSMVSPELPCGPDVIVAVSEDVAAPPPLPIQRRKSPRRAAPGVDFEERICGRAVPLVRTFLRPRDATRRGDRQAPRCS